jgi:hypothetical protein
MSSETHSNENVSSATGSPTGRRFRKTDYHKGMDATALALSISNHLKYTLAKHPEGRNAARPVLERGLAIRDRLVTAGSPRRRCTTTGT